jgi:hypothetical protein
LARNLDDDGIARLNASLMEPVMTDRARRRVSQHRRRVAVARFGGEVMAS